MNENTSPRRNLSLCTENRARSQMAEAIMRRRAGERFGAHSAGSRPASAIHPLAVEALREIGIDAAAAVPKNMGGLIDVEFDLVITLCGGARDVCPVFPGAPAREHWPIEDPAAAEGPQQERLAAFRAARDEIARRIDRLLETI